MKDSDSDFLGTFYWWKGARDILVGASSGGREFCRILNTNTGGTLRLILPDKSVWSWSGAGATFDEFFPESTLAKIGIAPHVHTGGPYYQLASTCDSGGAVEKMPLMNTVDSGTSVVVTAVPKAEGMKFRIGVVIQLRLTRQFQS